jgi:hypothetical protein
MEFLLLRQTLLPERYTKTPMKNCRSVNKINTKCDYNLRYFFLLGKGDSYTAEFLKIQFQIFLLKTCRYFPIFVKIGQK